MQMQPIKSSNIESAGHDPVNNILRVRFGNGTEYDYKNVDVRTFAEFMSAESQGKFYHKNIKSKLTGTKVETAKEM